MLYITEYVQLVLALDEKKTNKLKQSTKALLDGPILFHMQPAARFAQSLPYPHRPLGHRGALLTGADQRVQPCSQRHPSALEVELAPRIIITRARKIEEMKGIRLKITYEVLRMRYCYTADYTRGQIATFENSLKTLPHCWVTGSNLLYPPLLAE